MLQIVSLVLIAAAVSGSAGSDAAVKAAPVWNAYWAARGVVPAPPRDFLEGAFNGTIQNLTAGRLSDETVKQWVLADLRRGRGDQWAGYHLRLDLVNAGVFGPPGLNGTDSYVEKELKRGVVRIEGDGAVEIVAAGVVAVPKTPLTLEVKSGFTEYAVVMIFRDSGKSLRRVYSNGKVEEQPAREKAAAPRCQVDTGSFSDDPPLGPLWFQLRGWSAHPDDGTMFGALCALLKQ